MKKVLATLVAVILASAPAFAAVQNVKVSGDIDSTYVNRQHFNLGNKNGAGIENGLSDQSVFLTQTRLRVDADLSDNVSTTVGLINERAWDANTNQTSDVSIYLAYVTLREMLYSPLTVQVGRQVFNYGNALIIGDGGVNNQASADSGISSVANDFTKATAYDGIKAVLDYKPLTLDLIYFKADAGNVTGAIDVGSRDDVDVYGINANYQLGDAMNTVVEGYFFSRIDNSNIQSATKGDTLYVPGLRVSTNPIEGLNTQAELAWQLGKKTVSTGATATDDAHHGRQAMAAQFMANYTLPVLEQYKPVAMGSYTYVSGDKNADDSRPTPGTTPSANPASGETYTAWDPMYEAQGGGTIYNSLFDLTNMHIVALGLQVNPLEDVTAKFTWSGLWAAQEHRSNNTLIFRQPDGSSVTPTIDNDDKGIGNEYDVNLSYAYTEDVKIGLNLGWFIPGNLFDGRNDSTASQAIANVAVAF